MLRTRMGATAAVNCRVGSSEIDVTDVDRFDGVNCRVGSSEKSRGVIR